MKKGLIDSTNPVKCISSSIPSYKKGINNFNQIKDSHGGKKSLLEDIISMDQFRIAGSIDEEKELKLSNKELQLSSSFQFANPSDYLLHIRKYISTDIISQENFGEIHHLAEFFSENITSFFGFETKLNSIEPNSDYLFAISSKNGEREHLLHLLQQEDSSFEIINSPEWKRIKNFTKEWSQPTSLLHDQILGIWFEFDTAESFSGVPVPNIFFQTHKIRIDNKNDEQAFNWIPQKAIPIFTGKSLSPQVESKLKESIKKLPVGSSVFHFGTMLSRAQSGIRIIINRIKPDDVIPYLHSIGWAHDDGKLAQFISELKHYVSRIILHLNISDRVDEKIGIECSFSYDKYHTETGWNQFLEYLEKKQLCIPEKKDALLGFIGADYSQMDTTFSADEYIPSVMIHEHASSKALVRYLSHIKVVYAPNKPMIAKAYPGVRLLGSVYE